MSDLGPKSESIEDANVTAFKEMYFETDLVMSDLIRHYGRPLTEENKKKLILWAGTYE